jgi:hypothetical protein
MPARNRFIICHNHCTIHWSIKQLQCFTIMHNYINWFVSKALPPIKWSFCLFWGNNFCCALYSKKKKMFNKFHTHTCIESGFFWRNLKTYWQLNRFLLIRNSDHRSLLRKWSDNDQKLSSTHLYFMFLERKT